MLHSEGWRHENKIDLLALDEAPGERREKKRSRVVWNYRYGVYVHLNQNASCKEARYHQGASETPYSHPHIHRMKQNSLCSAGRKEKRLIRRRRRNSLQEWYQLTTGRRDRYSLTPISSSRRHPVYLLLSLLFLPFIFLVLLWHSPFIEMYRRTDEKTRKRLP